MRTIPRLSHTLASLLALAASLLPAFASAADPVPFPPDPDTAAIADGATLPKLVRRVEPVAPVDRDNAPVAAAAAPATPARAD